MLDWEAVNKFRHNALNPDHPVIRGTSQNPDIYFQGQESANPYYEAVPQMVEDAMAEINKLTGRNYQLFNYYGDPNADRVIIAMGSLCDTAMEVVDYLNAKGEKVGVVSIHLYRPFSVKHFLNALPKLLRKLLLWTVLKKLVLSVNLYILKFSPLFIIAIYVQQSLVVVMVLVVKMLLQIKSLQFIMNSKRCS